MKKLIVIVLILFIQNLHSQQSTLNWHTDLNKAVNISISENKPMMLFFTGSDWCGWCIRLKKEVFNYPEFEAWTKDNVVLVELDFPRRKTIDPKILNQNRELARIFGVSGYPTVWFVNPQKLDTNKLNFIKLGKLGYLAGGTNKWISTAENFLKTN
tara:strand:- start:558 stop:1025 length:468 start_codon:yes stop_codon:yes gene_type:complete